MGSAVSASISSHGRWCLKLQVSTYLPWYSPYETFMGRRLCIVLVHCPILASGIHRWHVPLFFPGLPTCCIFAAGPPPKATSVGTGVQLRHFRPKFLRANLKPINIFLSYLILSHVSRAAQAASIGTFPRGAPLLRALDHSPSFLSQ